MRTAASLARALIAALALLLALAPSPAFAQGASDHGQRLRQAEADIRAIERQAAGDVSEAERSLLRAKLAATRQAAVAVSKQLSGELAAVDARIAELGPKPGGAGEAPEVASRRAGLTAERLALDAAVKRAGLLDVEAEQIGLAIQRKNAEQFGNRMSRRGSSPLLPGFWAGVIDAFGGDFGRIGKFVADSEHQARTQGTAGNAIFALLGLIVAILLLNPGTRLARQLGQNWLVSDAPGMRIRRSAYAFWLIIVGTAAPLLAAVILVQGAKLSHMLPPNWGPLMTAFIRASASAGFIAAVFSALLMRRQPSWRVAPISDAVATRLRPLSWILAAIAFVGSMIDAFNEAVGASQAALSASMAIQAAGSLLLIGGALLAIGRVHAEEVERDDGTAMASAGASALALVLWLVVLVAFVALAFGYVDFSSFLVLMMVMATVVGAFTYLLLILVDDLSVAIFNQSSGLGRTLVRGVGIRGSAVDQFGVLLSGLLRVAVGFVAFVVLIAPFGAGSGVGSVFAQLGAFANGIEIGGVKLSPGAVIRGVIVLVIGLALVRGFMGWLDDRYLPATDLDGSGRNSVSMIARYVGIVLAVIWGLASLGIGIERVALLLSALSVGIGFGLQAITQNFVSGLILLAERPIKIGDLIKVGEDEGDVRRISVRSTELVLADHSTLIIPNSDLITKPVLNKTLANPLGRVQIRFSVPIETDAAQVEQILLDAYAAEPAILDDPAPSVFIDSIADGSMVFNSFAHVIGPRESYRARSNVYKTVLRQLREDHIPIGTPSQKLELVADPATLKPKADSAD